MEIGEITKKIKELEDALCDRHNIVALKTYFEGFTDERLTGILNALKSMRSLRGDLLTEEEIKTIDCLIGEIGTNENQGFITHEYPQKVTKKILDETRELIDCWCNTHNTGALGWILRGWPLEQVLETADWAKLLEALKMVRSLGSDYLSGDQATSVDHLIIEIDRMLNPKDFKHSSANRRR